MYNNYDFVDDILRSRKKLNFACGLFQIALRVLDINLTLLDIVNNFKKDPRFSNIHYFSSARVMQEVCIQSVLKFSNLLTFFKGHKELTFTKLGKLTWFLQTHANELQEPVSFMKKNIKSSAVIGIVKFMLKSKVIKFYQEQCKGKTSLAIKKEYRELFDLKYDEAGV